jgi:hypothetical protein
VRYLRYLRERGAAPVLLAVNFDSGHGDAGFGDLAERLPRHTVLETLPAAFGAPTGSPDAAHCVSRLLEEIAVLGVPVCGVLGYCAGAGLARLTAYHLAASWPIAPTLVLFDPSPVTEDALYWQFCVVVESLSAYLPGDELDRARSFVDSVRPPAGADIDRIADYVSVLAGQYARLLEISAARIGITPVLRAELSARFDSFLNYLACAIGAQRESKGVDGVVIASRDHQPLPGSGPQHRFDVPRGGLLACDEVAERVAELLP